MKVLSIVGARPQFIKASMLSRALHNRVREVMVHTGQHYDENMSKVFFDQLHLPKPDYELHVGSGSHGVQTANMLMRIEDIMLHERPDWVIVYGDTNSTLAGSLAAAKQSIPIAHIEAGLRSFRRGMPEEINRLLTDHMSSLLFCPTDTAVLNLAHEGIHDGVHQVGDIMCDALRHFRDQASQIALPETLNLTKPYAVATIHRADNTDRIERLQAILQALGMMRIPVLLPLHPRTRQAIRSFSLDSMLMRKPIVVCPPLSYLEMVKLVSEAHIVLTDSGGLQKEAYMLKVPCITLREETEWPETIQTGWNCLAGTKPAVIMSKVKTMQIPSDWPPLFGNGKTAEAITTTLLHSAS